jgi:quinol monooxygenase YgiN
MFSRLQEEEYLKAEGCLRYSLMMREQWYGKKHTMVSEVLHDLAGLLCMKENTQG